MGTQSLLDSYLQKYHNPFFCINPLLLNMFHFQDSLLPNMHNFGLLCLFIYLGFYIAFNTVQVISRPVVGRADETSTYSWSVFCTVNCRPTASNYQLSHLRLCRELNPGLRGGRRECYHSATVAPWVAVTRERILLL